MAEMLIGGKWVDGAGTIEVRNPYDNSVIDTVPRADEKCVDEAILSAVEGFKVMRGLPSHKRSEILAKTSQHLERELEKFANIISLEVGKTINEARLEVQRAAQTFAIGSEEAKRIHGETVPFDAAPGGVGRKGFFLRVPVGIVLAITPFNFPLNLAAHKLAPAFAAGNSVILKPATKTPLSAILLGEIMLNSGLPENGLNILTGSGEKIGEILVRDSRIRMVTFTGSADVGREIAKNGGLKKIVLELGSNCPVIIMEDADLSSAIPRIVAGGYAVAGQVCISVQRLIVQESIYDRFVGELTSALGKLKVGDQLNENTNMGPMISEDAAKRVEAWAREAVIDGAKCFPQLKREGTLLHPIVLTDVTPKMKVFSDEVFGPLVTVSKCKDILDAILLANNSRYGLQAGVFTKDLGKAFLAIDRLDVGGVIVNDIPTFRVDFMPYGGVKDSGLGREGLKYAIEEMTEMKIVCFKL